MPFVFPLRKRTAQPMRRYADHRRGKPPIPLSRMKTCHILSLSFSFFSSSETLKIIKHSALHCQQPPTHLTLLESLPCLIPSVSAIFISKSHLWHLKASPHVTTVIAFITLLPRLAEMPDYKFSPLAVHSKKKNSPHVLVLTGLLVSSDGVLQWHVAKQ